MPNEVLTPDLEKEILSIRRQIRQTAETYKLHLADEIAGIRIEFADKPKDNRAALAVVGLGLLVFWGAIAWAIVR